MVLMAGLGVEIQSLAAAFQDLKSEVASAFGPFIVLLGQYRTDQAGDGIAVGEDPHHIGAAADLFVQPLVGVIRPDLGPHVPRERGERQDLGPGAIEVIMDCWQLGLDVVQQTVELGVDTGCIRLVIDFSATSL